MIGTSTKVEISGIDVEKFDDKYFAKVEEKKKQKGEGEFFEAEKEVKDSIYLINLYLYQIFRSLQFDTNGCHDRFSFLFCVVILYSFIFLNVCFVLFFLLQQF